MRFYETVPSTLPPSGIIETPAAVAEASAALDARRWGAKTARDELAAAEAAATTADAVDRENEAQAALEGRDSPKPTRLPALKRLETVRRASAAQHEAARRAAHAFVTAVCNHSEEWAAATADARARARDRLLDQLTEVRQSFQRIEVLDFLLAALNSIEESGHNFAGWCVAVEPNDLAPDPLRWADEPRGNWLSRSAPIDIDEAIGDLAKHLAPTSEPEQVAHPGDSQYRESMAATIGAGSPLLGG